jgi:hypothetical protein
MSAARWVASVSPASAFRRRTRNQLKRDGECIQEIAQIVHHTAGNLHARFVQFAHEPLLQRQFVVCPLQTAGVFINFPVALGDRFPDGRDGDDAKRFIDQPPGAPFVAPRESFVRFRERLRHVRQHPPEQGELVDQFVDAIALLPADLSMCAGVAFDCRLRLFEVLRVKRGTDPVQDFRQMIGELGVR